MLLLVISSYFGGFSLILWKSSYWNSKFSLCVYILYISVYKIFDLHSKNQEFPSLNILPIWKRKYLYLSPLYISQLFIQNSYFIDMTFMVILYEMNSRGKLHRCIRCMQPGRCLTLRIRFIMSHAKIRAPCSWLFLRPPY